MKPIATLALLAVFGCVNAANDDTIGFGPYFPLGPTASWTRSAKTTLVLLKVPTPATDRLALWPGMGTSGNDLIQALAVSFPDPKANCDATPGQWCVWASTLQDGTQLGGKQVPANAGDSITMSCIKEFFRDPIRVRVISLSDQTVSVNGKQVCQPCQTLPARHKVGRRPSSIKHNFSMRQHRRGA